MYLQSSLGQASGMLGHQVQNRSQPGSDQGDHGDEITQNHEGDTELDKKSGHSQPILLAIGRQV